jgi:competence protein ComEA
MYILEKQIKGLVAIFLFLAIISFISFLPHSFFEYKIPEYAEQSGNFLAIKIVQRNTGKGVYFVSPNSTFNQLLLLTGIHSVTKKDFILENGINIEIDSGPDNLIKTAKMDNVDRLALEIPININHATEDDLLLIPGIGEKTAGKILEFRKRIGRFNKIEELTEIKGIKEKKLSKLRKYLLVE